MLQPEYDSDNDIYLPLSPVKIKEALDSNQDIAALYIMSPTEEGLIASYKAIRELCDHQKVLLIVDETYGGHFYFSSNTNNSALSCGADVTVSSTHKTLGTISSTGLLNVAKDSRLSQMKVRDAYHLLNTTSPSPFLLAELEGSVRLLHKDHSIIDHAIAMNQRF